MNKMISIDQPIRYLAFASFGLLVRILTTRAFKETLSHRVEIVTPLNDWKRAQEAIYLSDSGLDPYGGNIFHEYPINILTAILLQQSVHSQLKSDNESQQVSSRRSTLVYLIYLFSPLTILSCAGQSTSVFTNFLVTVILFISPIRAFRALTCVLCAMLACNNIYHIAFILPLLICMEYSSYKERPSRIQTTEEVVDTKQPYYTNSNFMSSLLNSMMICLASMITLLGTSYILTGYSWSFVRATYLFVLNVGDLTPNIGMLWYFFTEMFEHFLSFFTCVVQMIAFIQVIPLTIALRDRPHFALYIIASLSTICQPFPSLANIGLLTSILPQYSDLFQHLSQGLKVTCTCVTCICLWPVFWHLWIMMGTANANFYFGATLAFMAAAIFFIVDLINAHVYKMTKNKLDNYDATIRKQTTKSH